MKKKAKTDSVIKCSRLHRAAPLENINEDERRIEVAFSSEEPVERFFGIEILDHEKSSIRLDWFNTGNAPVLDQHNPDEQIGVVESAEIGADKVGRAVIRFGKNGLADERFKDVVDGIRANISVGYSVHKMILEEQSDDSPDTMRVVDWQPLEVSLVSVPADQTVGIGRSEGADANEVEILNPKQTRSIMDKDTKPSENSAESATPQPRVDVDKEVQKAREDERKRMSQIRALGDKHKMSERADEFINEGKSVDQFRDYVLENLPGVTPVRTEQLNPAIGLDEKDAKRFSFMKAVRASLVNDWSDAGFELEVSNATRKKHSDKKFEGAFSIPVDVMMASRSTPAKRDMSVGTVGEGGYLVGTEHVASSFIELLRGRMLVASLGARVLSGLVGNLAIPKQTGGVTTYWVSEGVSITESTPTTGQVALSPKTVGGYSDVTRKLLMQSSPDVEDMLRFDIASGLARAVDSAVYNGSGASGEPQGILQTSGRGQVDYGAGVTFGDVVDMETEVEVDDALEGSLAYVATPTLKGSMKQTLKDSGVSGYIWDEGKVNGYRAESTTLLTAGKILFGNWSDIVIGEWGVLDMVVDPFSNAPSGTVRIVGMQDVDVGIRHIQSFCEGYT